MAKQVGENCKAQSTLTWTDACLFLIVPTVEMFQHTLILNSQRKTRPSFCSAAKPAHSLSFLTATYSFSCFGVTKGTGFFFLFFFNKHNTHNYLLYYPSSLRQVFRNNTLIDLNTLYRKGSSFPSVNWAQNKYLERNCGLITTFAYVLSAWQVCSVWHGLFGLKGPRKPARVVATQMQTHKPISCGNRYVYVRSKGPGENMRNTKSFINWNLLESVLFHHLLSGHNNIYYLRNIKVFKDKIIIILYTHYSVLLLQ